MISTLSNQKSCLDFNTTFDLSCFLPDNSFSVFQMPTLCLVPRHLQLAKPACVSSVSLSHLHGDGSFLSKVLDWRGRDCSQCRSNSFSSYSHPVSTSMPGWPLRHSSACENCPQSLWVFSKTEKGGSFPAKFQEKDLG